jgi:hypothetical protein
MSIAWIGEGRRNDRRTGDKLLFQHGIKTPSAQNYTQASTPVQHPGSGVVVEWERESACEGALLEAHCFRLNKI